jgi:protein-disulfide isomerase/uncharacterized membrane protein
VVRALEQYGFFALAGVAALVGAGLTAGGPPGVALIAFVTAGALLCIGAVLRSARWGTLLTAIGCFASNAYLFSRKWESAVSGESICNINTTINCDVVNSSEWSLAFGVPITLFGMAFYAGLALAAISPGERRFFQVSTLFAIVNVLYSLFLGYHSLQLGAVCVLCISIYVGNAILLWAGLKGLAEQGGSLGDDIGGVPTSKDFLTIAAIFVLVVGVGGTQWKAQQPQSLIVGKSPDEPLTADDLMGLYEQPRGPVRLDGTEPIIGNPTAKYQVVEWADFGCPHCRDAWHELHELTKERQDLQVRFRVFPLTGDCNPLLQPHGPERCNAAYAAECARQQGRFLEMGTLLFENQGYFSTDDLEFMAQQAGLDVAKWKTCLADPATAAGVLNDAKQGGEAGVLGTPSLFLKGATGDEFISITRGPPAVKAIIEAAEAGVKLHPAPPPAPLPN